MLIPCDSGNEIGPFRGIEESIVAHLTDPAKRGDVYAWYSLCGTAGGAFGLLTCGWVIHHMRVNLGMDVIDVYRNVFYGYSAIGVLKFISAVVLSVAVEVHDEVDKQTPASNAATNEQAPLLTQSGQASTPNQAPPKKQLRAKVSRESIPVVVSLCALFALDSFASGLAPL
jgi:hypothetical protein